MSWFKNDESVVEKSVWKLITFAAEMK